MSIKISLFKSTADGEQLNSEFNLESHEYTRIKAGERLREIFAPYFRLADDRLLEMNTRIMFANKLVRQLEPAAQVAFHNIMDVLHGQKPSDPTYAEMLQKSISETTESLIKQGIDPKLIKQIVRDSYGIRETEVKDAEPTSPQS